MPMADASDMHSRRPSPAQNLAGRAPQMSADLVAPSRTESVPAIRTQVSSLLQKWGVRTEIRDDAGLLVSELVTNAVLHTHGHQITVQVTYGEGQVRCLVRDDDPTLPDRPCIPEYHEEAGRGLLLVQAIAARWGSHLVPDPEQGKKVVWFELDDAMPGAALPRRERHQVASNVRVSVAEPVDPVLLRRVLVGLRHR
jgi:serine/threonine-protein kinase RsbW